MIGLVMACEVTGGDQRRKVVVKARSGSNGVGLKKINKINDLAGPEGFFLCRPKILQ